MFAITFRLITFALTQRLCDVWDAYQSSDKSFFAVIMQKELALIHLKRLALSPHDFQNVIRCLFEQKYIL